MGMITKDQWAMYESIAQPSGGHTDNARIVVYPELYYALLHMREVIEQALDALEAGKDGAAASILMSYSTRHYPHE